MIVRLGPEAALHYLPQLAGPVLQMWGEHVADPLISEDALEVLQVGWWLVVWVL